MREINEISTLPIFRYRVKLCHNEDGDAWQLSEGPFPDPMELKYQQVVAQMHSLSAQEGDIVPSLSEQAFRNRLSTLHSFLSYHGKTLESSVGRELLSRFDESLRSYSASLQVGDHAKSDRRSHLRAWRKVADALICEKGETNIAPAL